MNKEMIIAQAKADKKRGLKLDPLNPDDLENVMMEYGYDDEELAIYKDAYFGTKTIKEGLNKNELAKFIKSSVKDLTEEDYGCAKFDLDGNLAVFVGWSGGWGKELRDDVIQSKENPDYALDCGIRVRNEADWSDFDFLRCPYFEGEGEDLDITYSISPNEDYDALAAQLIKDYEDIKDYDIDSDGKLTKVEEAFSYEDDEFFTREEVDDFAEKVCDHVNETFNEVFKVQESYITDNEIEVVVYNDDLGEFTGKKKVDMRRIRKPSDLDKYVLDIAADIIEEIKEVLIDSDYHDADEDELRKMGVFDESLTEDSADIYTYTGGRVPEDFNFKKVVIADGVTSIEDAAFEGCDSLTSVLIPDSVTFIGDRAFYNCDSLTEIVIPDSVTSIDSEAFSNCDSLKSIVIPDSVTSIGYDTFQFCDSLTSITIGNSVTSIGDGAFFGCTSLTSITIPNSVTSIGRDAFYGCYSLTIYCEAKSQPNEWNKKWNSLDCPVVWGYKEQPTNDNSEKTITEDSDDDGPYSYKETEAELQSLTQNWTREKDQLKCGYDEEKNYGMEILSKHGYECNADKQGGWWIVDYWKDLDSDKKGVRFGKAKKAIDFDPITYDEDIFKPGTIVEFMEDVLYGDAEVVAEAELDKYPITDAEVDEFITKHGFKMSNEDKGMFYIPRGTRAKFIGELDAGPSWPMFEVNGIELEFAGDEPFKVIIIDDSITEATTMRHGWYGSRYTDYNKEDGWTDEDIAKHKEINWQERNYHDYPIPEDSFTGEAIAHTDNGTKRARVKFIKYLRSNPIFPPYYAPENNPFTDVVGPMYNGHKHGSYGIHDMYESQDIYDTQSH